jgi:hypothetical protein
MNGNVGTAGERSRCVEQIAAELTEAAYGVALRHVKKGSWVDLELGLWKALAEKLKTWEKGRMGLA